MSRNNDRIIAVLARAGVPMRTDHVAKVLGESVRAVSTDLSHLHHSHRVVRGGERGTSKTGSLRLWSLPAEAPPVRLTTAERILAMLDEPKRTAQIAAALRISEKSARAELNRLRMLGRVDYVTGPHGNEWRRAEPTNVVPLRPGPTAPLRMLPVIRRYDCAHEPECSMAAAKEWPEAEGMTCPVACAEYEKAPRVAVPRPSNWMGGEG